LDLPPLTPPPYSAIDQNRNRLKNKKRSAPPLHVPNREHYESLRQREGQRFYSYSVEPSYHARSRYVPKEYSQSEPRLRVRPYSCSDVFIDKKVSFDEDFTRVRLDFEDTDFSGDDLFCKPPDYSTMDRTDYFESLKRRERIIKSRSDDHLHFLSLSRSHSNTSNSMTSLTSLSEVNGSLPNNNKKRFNYVRFSEEIQSTDDITEDNMSITSELEMFRGLQYESDHSTSIYVTSDDERDNCGRVNSSGLSNQNLLESNIFDEFDAIAESMATVTSQTAKNHYSSMLRGKSVEKMEAIKESDGEKILGKRCLHSVSVGFISSEDKENSTTYNSSLDVGESSFLLKPVKINEEIIESDCEEIFHSKCFEENSSKPYEGCSSMLLHSPMTTAEVVESECEEVVLEKDPDFSPVAYQFVDTGVSSDGFKGSSSNSIMILSKKLPSSATDNINSAGFASPTQNEAATREDINNNSIKVRSSLSHELFLNRKEDKPFLSTHSYDANTNSKTSLKSCYETIKHQENQASDWTSTSLVQLIKHHDSLEPCYDNRFKFTLGDFQSIFCGMKVVSDKFILINTKNATKHPRFDKYEMTDNARNTSGKGIKSLTLSVGQKRTPRVKNDWFYRTFCIYDLTKTKTRTCSSIHFELDNGRVQSSTKFMRDDVIEHVQDRLNSMKIKVEYNY